MCGSQPYDVGFKSHRGQRILMIFGRLWNGILLRFYRLVLIRLTPSELEDELEYWQIQNHRGYYLNDWDKSMLSSIVAEYSRRGLPLIQ